MRSLHHRLRTRRAAERLRSESASSDELSWIQSSYLIAEIIVIPLSAWLSCVMSTRWLLAASDSAPSKHNPLMRNSLDVGPLNP